MVAIPVARVLQHRRRAKGERFPQFLQRLDAHTSLDHLEQIP